MQQGLQPQDCGGASVQQGLLPRPCVSGGHYRCCMQCRITAVQQGLLPRSYFSACHYRCCMQCSRVCWPGPALVVATTAAAVQNYSSAAGSAGPALRQWQPLPLQQCRITAVQQGLMSRSCFSGGHCRCCSAELQQCSRVCCPCAALVTATVLNHKQQAFYFVRSHASANVYQRCFFREICSEIYLIYFQRQFSGKKSSDHKIHLIAYFSTFLNIIFHRFHSFSRKFFEEIQLNLHYVVFSFNIININTYDS